MKTVVQEGVRVPARCRPWQMLSMCVKDTTFSPVPKMRRSPFRAVSIMFGRKSMSVGPYTWCGAIAQVDRVAQLASRINVSPRALVRAYSCR